DLGGALHCLDRQTGVQCWQAVLDPHPAAALYSSPMMVGKYLLQAVASVEELSAGEPGYVPTFRGSLVMLDPRDGRTIWQTYTITNEEHAAGASGAAIWGTPTYDEETNKIVVGTGNNYSQPTTDSSDAILFIDASSGAILKKIQTTASDYWNTGYLPEDPKD